jgi:hypothetical protein
MSTHDIEARIAALAPPENTADAHVPGLADVAHAHELMTSTGGDAGAHIGAVIPLAPRRRRTRRAVIGFAAASVLGLVAGGVSVVLPTDSPVPGAPPAASAAAIEIEKLAQRAEASPIRLTPGTYLYTVDRQNNPRIERRQTWRAYDGREWWRLDGGEPNLAPPPEALPGIGVTMTAAGFATMPTDPDQLREQLFRRIPRTSSISEGDHDRLIFGVIETVLMSGISSPELNAAMLRVLAGLSTVQVQPGSTTPGGLTGTGLTVGELTYENGGGQMQSVLVVDPDTSEFLARALKLPLENGSRDLWLERISAKVVDDLPAKIRRDAVPVSGSD